MADAAETNFSVVQKGEAWFWRSPSLVKANELIGHFPPSWKRRKTLGRRSERNGTGR
jgi:hypothetical protein